MNGRIVATRRGKVRGIERDGVDVYYNIPYARAPVGSLRFSLPVSPEPWWDVRDAQVPGRIAPQPIVGLGSYVPGDPIEQGEDSCVLNVFTGTEGSEFGKRPVMVFFHGGAFVNGSGSSLLYDGSSLARRDVVVVTFNYRLGALGYLAHPALAEGGSSMGGNFGLADQVAVLCWVRDEIAAFGGDPKNVTAFGESAGAMSIADLLGVDAARSLFHRAILQSGSFVTHSAGRATELAEQFFRELGIKGATRDLLQDVPLDDILAAQEQVSRAFGGALGMAFRPVVGGALLAEDPSKSLRRGTSRGIDIIAGTNRDEFCLFTFALPELGDLSLEGLVPLVERYMGQSGVAQPLGSAARLVEGYAAITASRGADVSARTLLDAIGTDLVFRIPVTQLIEGHSIQKGSAFSYLFEWESPLGDGRLGSCHGLELGFVFGSLTNPIIGVFTGTGPAANALSDAMQDAWVSFARSGSPRPSGESAWSKYSMNVRETMIFGESMRVEVDPWRQERALYFADPDPPSRIAAD